MQSQDPSAIGFPRAQSSQLAVFGGRGMSFNICRGTLGSLAMFIAIRNGAAVAVCGQLGRWTDQEEHKRRRD
jgi:hypothetical protein